MLQSVLDLCTGHFLSFIPIIFKSHSTSSHHILSGRLLFLIPSAVAAAICCGILWFCILSTWPHHLSWKNFMNFYSFFPLVFKDLVYRNTLKFDNAIYSLTIRRGQAGGPWPPYYVLSLFRKERFKTVKTVPFIKRMCTISKHSNYD